MGPTATDRAIPFLWTVTPLCTIIGALAGWEMGVARDAIFPFRAGIGLVLGLGVGWSLSRAVGKRVR